MVGTTIQYGMVRHRRLPGWRSLAVAAVTVLLLAGVCYLAVDYLVEHRRREQIAAILSGYDRPGIDSVPATKVVHARTDDSTVEVSVNGLDFRFRLPRDWRVDRSRAAAENRGAAVSLLHADGREVNFTYSRLASLTDPPDQGLVSALAPYLGSAEAAEEFIGGFRSDLALFEAAYRVTPGGIDVHGNLEQLRRDWALLHFKSGRTLAQHRLEGTGAYGYVGARSRSSGPTHNLTTVELLDERGQYRGFITIPGLRYPDPRSPAHDVLHELLATARFEPRRLEQPVTTAVDAPRETAGSRK